MNREIKFRGKSKNSGEWLYGYLFNYELSLTAVTPCINICIPASLEEVYSDCTVYSDTIGQYTGLRDNSGKEIYEGDIIEFYDLEFNCINPDCDAHLHGRGSFLRKKKAVVKFNEGIFGVCNDSNDSLTPLSYCGISKEMANDMKEDTYLATNGYGFYNPIVGVKVIGNIYDNPELLKRCANE